MSNAAECCPFFPYERRQGTRAEQLENPDQTPLAFSDLVDVCLADSIYIFSGSNSDCEVMLKIYNDKDNFEIGQAYVKMERDCKNDSLDISVDEFQKLWYK